MGGPDYEKFNFYFSGPLNLSICVLMWTYYGNTSENNLRNVSTWEHYLKIREKCNDIFYEEDDDLDEEITEN